MIRHGEYVREHLTATEGERIEHENVQPNGVDLRVGEIKRISGDVAEFYQENYNKPERTAIEPDYHDYHSTEVYRLHSGRYIIVYDEEIKIPDGHVGRVYPRSRVMRSGMHLTSALWDQGYEGRGEGLLQVPPSLDYVDIQVGAALAQMVFETADEVEQFETYDGSHQGERLCE